MLINGWLIIESIQSRRWWQSIHQHILRNINKTPMFLHTTWLPDVSLITILCFRERRRVQEELFDNIFSHYSAPAQTHICRLPNSRSPWSLLCSQGHMENCVLVSCALRYHHIDVQLQGSVWPTACNQCMSTTRQGTCDASLWPSCHRWRATWMLLPKHSSLTLCIRVHGLLVALERPKDNAYDKAMKCM